MSPGGAGQFTGIFTSDESDACDCDPTDCDEERREAPPETVDVVDGELRAGGCVQTMLADSSKDIFADDALP